MTFEILPRYEDGSPEWLEQRRQGVGASDTAAILGLAPAGWGATPLSVYRSKKGIEADIPENLAYFGHALEAPLAQWVRDKHPEVGFVGDGIDVRWVEHPWLTAKPDRIIYPAFFEAMCAQSAIAGLGLTGASERIADRNPIPLELKTSSAFARSHWDDGVPLWYQVQVQQQIAILGAPYGWLAVLHGGNDPELYRIERDQEFIDDVLIPRTREFWEQVQSNVEPEPTTFTDLATFEGDPEITVEGSEDLYDLWDEYGRIQSVIVENRDLLDEVKLQLQIAMKDATALTFEGRELFTWRRNKPTRRFDKTGFEKAHPELARQFAKTVQGARPFKRITKKEIEK